ncbi:MAG: DUF2958 domain-containing protein [Sideroxyarcus sp.]|nr:DUF2958 domain-containing protein [Sideroxyarcus sp.]
MIDATLIPFLPKYQCFQIAECLQGEEREFFAAKMEELRGIISTMPVTYQQDELGDQAIVHLHYFYGNCHWYITEKDMEGDGTIQAYGMADIGYGPESGYISIEEIVQSDIPVELDLYWQPKTCAEILSKHKT